MRMKSCCAAKPTRACKRLRDKGIALLIVPLLLLCAAPLPPAAAQPAEVRPGERADTVPGNMMQNAEFDTADFADGINFGKWYPNGAVLSKDETTFFTGGSAMRVGGRTAFWNRAEFRVWGGNVPLNTDYYLRLAAAASSATTLEFHLSIGGWDGSGWPSTDFRLDSAEVAPGGWAILDGTLRIGSEPSGEDGFINLLVTYNGVQTARVDRVSVLDTVTLFVQEGYHENSSCPDLYLDSVLFRPGGNPHADGADTETLPENLIRNAGFEADDFAAGHNFGKWYPTPGGTAVLEKLNSYSHSGRSSLKVSGRTRFYDRAQYRVWGGDILPGADYTLSGYVSAAAETQVQLVLDAFGYTGSDWPGREGLVLSTGTAGPSGWTSLSGAVRITTAPNAEDAERVDVTIAYGGEAVVIPNVKGLDCLQFYIQQPSDAATFPDLYLDSFLLKRVMAEPPDPGDPDGHAGGADTQTDPGNLLKNAGFESDDFATDHNFGKWYPAPGSGAALIRLDAYSQSGISSLKVSGRAAHWSRAQYRVEGGELLLGHSYALSGYVSAKADMTAELCIEVFGYGGPDDNPYPSESFVLASGAAGRSGWTRLAGSLSITRRAAARDGKVDLIVTCGDRTAVISGVSGLSGVQIMVQEAYTADTNRPDMYLDSFLLKDVTPPAPPPTGHTGAADTQQEPGNLIANAGFEAADFSEEMAFGKWYADPSGLSLTRDTTYSHSGASSLRISSRRAFWNRAAYRIEGAGLSLGRTYDLSGYVSAHEETGAELYVQVFGYAGTEDNRTFPTQSVTLSGGQASSGAWTKLSGSFTMTLSASGNTGLYDLIITHSAGEPVVIHDVLGLSGIMIFVQEPYSEASPRTDLYLDSFLLKDVTPPAPRPTGHTGAADTSLDPNNLIRNAGFESDDFVSQQYVFGKWYTMEGCPAVLTRDTAYSHSGKASLRVGNRQTFWHRAEYRVEGSQIIVGHPYALSGYVSAAQNTRAELLLQVYGYGGPAGDPYPSQSLTLDAGVASPGKWTELSGTLRITAAAGRESGFYDYTISHSGSGEKVLISNVRGISGIQIMVQESYEETGPRADLYLDSFLMKDTAPKTPPPPAPTGHTGAPDSSETEGNLINNPGFEADLFSDEMCFGMWFRNGPGYDVGLVDSFSHSGRRSVRVSGRRASNNTLVYRVEGGSVKLDTPYTLTGYAAALEKTDVLLMLCIYGYAGPADNRTYPNKTVVLSRETAGQDWTRLGGSFSLHARDGRLSLTTRDGTIDIGDCIGLSGVELYAVTDETAANHATDLYLDTFSLVAGGPSGGGDPSGSGDGPVIPVLREPGLDETADIGAMAPGGQAADGPKRTGGRETLYIALLAVGGAVILFSIGLLVYTFKWKGKRTGSDAVDNSAV